MTFSGIKEHTSANSIDLGGNTTERKKGRLLKPNEQEIERRKRQSEEIAKLQGGSTSWNFSRKE